MCSLGMFGELGNLLTFVNILQAKFYKVVDYLLFEIHINIKMLCSPASGCADEFCHSYTSDGPFIFDSSPVFTQFLYYLSP